MEEATLIKRVMPNSLEAEQSVIGSMIMDREAIITAMEILLKEDFYHQQYGIVFEAMIELFNENQPVDLVTLQNRLKEKDVPQENRFIVVKPAQYYMLAKDVAVNTNFTTTNGGDWQ